MVRIERSIVIGDSKAHTSGDCGTHDDDACAPSGIPRTPGLGFDLGNRRRVEQIDVQSTIDGRGVRHRDVHVNGGIHQNASWTNQDGLGGRIGLGLFGNNQLGRVISEGGHRNGHREHESQRHQGCDHLAHGFLLMEIIVYLKELTYHLNYQTS
jgi:hypothetical protein